MIIRTIKDRENPYTQVPNEIINSPLLSYKAKGILIYLISKPNNWETRMEDIAKHGKEGVDSIRTGINELIKAGYIIRKRTREKNGKMAGWESLVYEKPQLKPTDMGKTDIGKITDTVKSPTLEKPISENPTLVNTEKEISTNIKNTYVSEFEEFWENYPRKTDKKQAYFQWRARVKSGVSSDDLLVAAKNYSAECRQLKREERYIKHAKTFIGAHGSYEEYLKKEEYFEGINISNIGMLPDPPTEEEEEADRKRFKEKLERLRKEMGGDK